MGVFARRDLGDTLSQLILPRVPFGSNAAVITGTSAMRHSAVWACLRLRADLISTMPLDVFARRDGVQTQLTTPPLLVKPDGGPLVHWLYSTQLDLDRFGNAFGIISRGADGFPARIDLVDSGRVIVKGNGTNVTGFRVNGADLSTDQVWHEKQFTVAGMPLGLSPVAYAAWSISGYLSAQQFAADWFINGAQPSGTLRNTEQSQLGEPVIRAAKERFKSATASNDLFVTGKDWEFTPASIDAAGSAFLEEMRYGISDVARFFGVPGDIIDAERTKGSITYANVTQRNLQLLVMNLGPAIVRRETALSDALYLRRYVKFNTDALLRMDPAQRASMLAAQVAARLRTPTEARELDNYRPYTPEQVAEFTALYGAPGGKPEAIGAGA